MKTTKINKLHPIQTNIGFDKLITYALLSNQFGLALKYEYAMDYSLKVLNITYVQK